MREYWVEFNFVETPYGKRPDFIRSFKTKEEANEFAATTADGKVVAIDWEAN